MLLMVQDLNREQLDELKTAYFWQDETHDILPDDITFPEQIPDDIILEHYDGICFVLDDFFCTAENDNFENCGAAYQDI